MCTFTYVYVRLTYGLKCTFDVRLLPLLAHRPLLFLYTDILSTSGCANIKNVVTCRGRSAKSGHKRTSNVHIKPYVRRT